MRMNRRRFLQAAAISGAASLVPLYLSRDVFAGYAAKDFNAPLAIPPELKGRMVGGKRVYDMTLQRGSMQFFEGLDTPTAGINGNYLGPVIRARRGESALFNVKNQLGEPSTIHWHGLHLPARMDGGPHQTIAPGQTWRPEFDINQPASTQWYHSHMYHRTGVQVYYGLAGLFYIDDEHSQNMDLPDQYGVNDIPLVIQDRRFKRDGSFHYISGMRDQMLGVLGNDILVNGVVRPKYEVRQKQMRFRILNGSNARSYNLEFSDQREFVQIASDGGLLEKAVRMRQLHVSPGERAEIVVQFENNEDVMLQHKPLPENKRARGMMAMMMSGNDRPFNVMRFTSHDPQGEVVKIPARLATIPVWSVADAAVTRRFDLDMQMMGMGMMGGGGNGGGFSINNKSYELEHIDAVVRLNDIEIWEFTNNSPMPHPMHIHDIQFRILDRNGKLPPLNERGLKDTVLVNADETVRVITKFENYADENSPYMYHCHILEHEDRGMMGQFVVKA